MKLFRHAHDYLTCRRERRQLLAARKEWTQPILAQAALVSIVTPTKFRWRTLIERTMPSVLAQTMKDFEWLVVTDGNDDTDEPKYSRYLTDPRIRFIRGPLSHYPLSGEARHCVGGTNEYNLGMDMASGDFIAILDDDDILTPNSLEKQVEVILATEAELVFGKPMRDAFVGCWVTYPSGLPFAKFGCAHSGVMHVNYLKLFRYDPHSYKVGFGADRLRWIHMIKAGVTTAENTNPTVYTLMHDSDRTDWDAPVYEKRMG